MVGDVAAGLAGSHAGGMVDPPVGGVLHAAVGPRGARPGIAITADDLQRLDVPSLFVWGEKDTFGSPEVGERAVALLPQAELVRVPHGHVPWVTDAAAVARPIRDWLTASLPHRAV